MALILQAHCINDAVYLNAYKLHILIACLFYFSATIQILLSGDCWWAERSAKLRPLRWGRVTMLTATSLQKYLSCILFRHYYKIRSTCMGNLLLASPTLCSLFFPCRKNHAQKRCLCFILEPLITLMPDLCMRHFVECPALLLANGAIAKRPQFKRGY